MLASSEVKKWSRPVLLRAKRVWRSLAAFAAANENKGFASRISRWRGFMLTHSVLLVALAVANVPLVLQQQSHVADIAWPTHGVVTLPRGWVKANDHLHLTENDRPIAAQIEIVARWPDESPKWVHVHAPFRYTAGRPARYTLVRQAQPPADLPRSPLVVTDNAEGISIDTGVVKLHIARPFAGITRAERDGKLLIDGAGGPRLVDARGIEWRAVHDASAEVKVEQQGPAQVTVRAEGWYQSADKRVEPFCRFVTRIVAAAGSSIVKVDHATVFADDMRKHSLAELAFSFAVPKVSGFASGPLTGTLTDQAPATYFAQLSPKQLITLAQQGGEHSKLGLKVTGQHDRSAGWFLARASGGDVAMLTKDFWQKCPKEVMVGRDELTYFAWPRHGDLAAPDPAALKPEEIYKFQCFLTGKLLDSRLPSDYFTALELQRDTTECKATYARAANMSGVAMHNEFALVLGGDGNTGAKDYWDSLQRLYVQSPIARSAPVAFASSGVLGPVMASGGDFKQLDHTAREGMLGYARSIERYGDYGWCIYGNTHHEQFMNPQAAGVPQGRPSLHRVWANNHYQQASTSWRLFSLDGDPRLLNWARSVTDNYASIGQVRYDRLRGYMTGDEKRREGPEVKWHMPGAFWHCKTFVPWGCRDYGMDSNDADSGLIGHWPDPSGLLLAWLVDANRWAKDGYELWLANVKFPSGGSRREVNVSFVHAITAYEYQPTPERWAAIKGMAASLSSVPLVQQHPGPLFEPTWVSRYYELFPDDEKFNKFIIESADTCGMIINNTWTMALCATAYRITKNEDYLRRHAGSLARAQRQLFQDPHPDKRWENYGFDPGPDRDHHFMLQWHRFAAALRDAGISSLPAPNEPGTFLCGACGVDNPRDVAERGTKVLVWRDAAAMPIDVQATTVSGGDLHPTSLRVVAPSGQAVLEVPRLSAAGKKGIERITRPSSWEVMSEKLSAPGGPTGLYQILIGSSEIGIFQDLTKLPQCQVLRRAKRPNNTPQAVHVAKVSRGYLVPLSKRKIDMTFQAAGDRDGSYVAINNKSGQAVASRYLRAGESVTVSLNAPSDPGPWLLDLLSENSGFVRITIAADVDEPLLYGASLEHVELIRGKLAR